MGIHDPEPVEMIKKSDPGISHRQNQIPLTVCYGYNLRKRNSFVNQCANRFWGGAKKPVSLFKIQKFSIRIRLGPIQKVGVYPMLPEAFY
jgi:hypothetical protein